MIGKPQHCHLPAAGSFSGNTEQSMSITEDGLTCDGATIQDQGLDDRQFSPLCCLSMTMHLRNCTSRQGGEHDCDACGVQLEEGCVATEGLKGASFIYLEFIRWAIRLCSLSVEFSLAGPIF